MRDVQRVLAGVYGPPRESTIYADISVDAAVAERAIAAERAAGRQCTLTALACLAAAHALRSVPHANVVWRRGRFRRRDDVSTWVYGTTPDGHVTGILVRHDLPGAGTLAAVQARIASARRQAGGPPQARSFYDSLGRAGPGTVRRMLAALSAWLHDAEGRFRPGRLDRAGFGAVGITNVGSIGIPTAPAIPIPPHARHVVLVSIGTVQDHAWVRDGAVVAGRRLPMTASLDHRAFVGLTAGALMAAFQQALTDEALLGRLMRDGA